MQHAVHGGAAQSGTQQVFHCRAQPTHPPPRHKKTDSQKQTSAHLLVMLPRLRMRSARSANIWSATLPPARTRRRCATFSSSSLRSYSPVSCRRHVRCIILNAAISGAFDVRGGVPACPPAACYHTAAFPAQGLGCFTIKAMPASYMSQAMLARRAALSSSSRRLHSRVPFHRMLSFGAGCRLACVCCRCDHSLALPAGPATPTPSYTPWLSQGQTCPERGTTLPHAASQAVPQ